MQVQFDGDFYLSTGEGRNSTSWKVKSWRWSEFLERIKKTHKTAETVKEYTKLLKSRQDEIKDVGGFVGGQVTGGRRLMKNIVSRQLLTLDVDFSKAGFWESFCLLNDYAAALYSTHKHTPESPRLRLLIPLDRAVNVEEHGAISRKVAECIGFDLFDRTTHDNNRLMYWPSTSSDGVYDFQYQDGDWLKADDVLAMYADWRDMSQWPGIDEGKTGADTKESPLDKKGIIGAWCRTYTISQVIEKFLSDVYESCDVEGRFTKIGGSTSAGLIVFDDIDSKSYHNSDVANDGFNKNAFDLVRVHKYGYLDVNSKQGTPHNKLPSFSKMMEFALSDAEVRKTMATEKLEKAKAEFGDEMLADEPEEKPSTEWMAGLDADEKGNYTPTRKNFQLILLNDHRLKNKFAYDVFGKRKMVVGNLPWRKVPADGAMLRDEDECDLRIYLSKKPYELSNAASTKDVFDSIVAKNEVHPVKEYLDKLVWDGQRRIDTLFIDYMGVEDNPFHRAISRKTLVAAVARIYAPGCQFDHILTLIGEEGKKKSSLFRALGRKWFSDSFSFEMIKRGKEAFEQLQGYWLIEVSELSGLSKSEVEAVKQFITKRSDVYRIPHEKYTSEFPRQCIKVASTNKWGFLKNNNGNRRFWPMPIWVNAPNKKVSEDLTGAEVDQVWAEAISFYEAGETLYLDEEMEKEARRIQAGHTEQDDRAGVIALYLDKLLPKNWDSLSLANRRSFIKADSIESLTDDFEEGTQLRKKVCPAEIWVECLGRDIGDINQSNTKELFLIMETMEGWVRSSGQLRFGIYGKCNGFTRKEGFLTADASGSVAVSINANL